MKKIRKNYKIFLGLFVFVILLSSIFVVYSHNNTFFSNLFKKTHKIIPSAFGKPNGISNYEFPSKKPEFIAEVSTLNLKPAQQPNKRYHVGDPKKGHIDQLSSNLNLTALKQQGISIYRKGDPKKVQLFQRSFYADGFKGSTLTYSFSKDSNVFTQDGLLGTIGCSSDNCVMMWSNFYKWDSQKNTFVLDNISHKDTFQTLLDIYQTIDNIGCKIIDTQVEPNQSSLSFTDLYIKYPNLKWYCNQKKGVVPTNLTLFLKTEKAIREVIDGKNINSADIQTLSL